MYKKAKDIIKELGSLSYLGLLPVVGGVVGGISGNMITDKKIGKKKFQTRLKKLLFNIWQIFSCVTLVQPVL
ncbi:MAG: hypothetical protein L6V95_04585 [Candidatus Melainabacteria bacterium]|nr:MAG: hypothetical protein L6V95_04585 [Candidatus Melainabacteria bacterium]